MKFGVSDQFLMLHRIDKALTMGYHSDAANCCMLQHRAAYRSIMLHNILNTQNASYGLCLRSCDSLKRNIDHEPIIGQRERGKEVDLIHAN